MLPLLKKRLKALVLFPIALLIAYITYLNIRLYYSPNFSEDGSINESVLAQLRYLKGEMRKGAAEDMQQIYPEGFVFLHAIYALAWSNTLQEVEPTAPVFAEGLAEIDISIEAISSSYGQTPFSMLCKPPLGAYYNGWRGYAIARRLQLYPDSALQQEYMAICDTLAGALKESPSPFLASYPKSAWPADMSVCMAALATHDRLFPPKYQTLIANWLTRAEAHTDSLGLHAHYTDVQTGDPLVQAQGASQSLILNFLWEIDTAYAKQKFAIYRQAFVDERLGLPGVREYPNQKEGKEHIDSGPVIWGIGGVASIVGQRVMMLYREDDLAAGLRNSIEAFGLGLHWGEHKSYLFGQLPMADVFIAWVNSTEYSKNQRVNPSWYWRWKFQLLSLLVLGLLVWVWRRV